MTKLNERYAHIAMEEGRDVSNTAKRAILDKLEAHDKKVCKGGNLTDKYFYDVLSSAKLGTVAICLADDQDPIDVYQTLIKHITTKVSPLVYKLKTKGDMEDTEMVDNTITLSTRDYILTALKDTVSRRGLACHLFDLETTVDVPPPPECYKVLKSVDDAPIRY